MGRSKAGPHLEHKGRLALVALVFVGCDGGAGTGTRDVAPDAAPDVVETTDTTALDPDVTSDTTASDTYADVADSSPDTTPDVADTTPDTFPDVTDTTVSDTTDTTPSAPPTLWMTVAQVPASMNGSRPAITPEGPLPYTLRVNRAAFELDVFATDVNWDTLDLACTDSEAARIALPALDARSSTWRQLVFGQVIAPSGRLTCTATISGPLGSANTTYTFDTSDLPAALDPFPETDVWVVQTDRDTFRLQVVELPDGSVDLRSTQVPDGDGVDDFDAPFFELGLMSRTSPANARLVRDHLLRKVKAHVQAIYGLTPEGQPATGPDLAILFEGDPGTPDPATYDGTNFSRIALTGDANTADQLAGTFGRALIDWNNQEKEDNTVFGLGVWPTALARGILRNSLGVLLLEPYRPAQGGVAFGDDPDDLQFLGRDDVDPATLTGSAPSRYAIYELVMDLGGMALASILAHEIGHSLGLVPPGAPPSGLFAGMDVDFVVTVTDDAHIDTDGLNVMQTGGNLNISEAIGGERPVFEPLSWAYLRRQLVVGP